MPQVSEIVDITITRDTKPATRSSFGVVLFAGDSGKLRDKDEILVDIDAQFVTSNVIAGKIQGVAITPVNFTTDSDTTMGLLATEIASAAAVATAVASDFGAVGYDNRITAEAAAVDTQLQFTEFAVTGGASQPTISITRNAYARTKKYTSITEVAADFASTDPEYVGANQFFSQSPNPGELKIGRVDSGEDWDDALDAIKAFDNVWYGLGATTRTQAKVEDVAAWVETERGTTQKNPKQFVTASADVNILNSGVTSDLASVLQAAEYDGSLVLYHQDAATTYPELEWIAEMYSKDPGTATWKFKKLDSSDPSELTSTQAAAAIAKNANTYETFGDTDMTREGVMSSGEFADVIRGIDWLESTMSSAIFAMLVAVDKVAYQNSGIQAVAGEVRATLDAGISVGLLRSAPEDFNGQPYLVTTKKVSEISATDRSNRLLPSDAITFQAKIAGAIHKVEINGTVAV
jgi:hypothetical protein